MLRRTTPRLRIVALGRPAARRRGRRHHAGAPHRPAPTDPASERRGSSASATRPSPARPAAGPATPTTAPTSSTPAAPTPTGTTPAAPPRPIPGCHRSESAAIHIGGGVSSLNLACSGAKTYTSGGGSSDFKPGIDFANTAYGKGQALAAAGVRLDAQREDGGGDDRRQRLRVRRHPADVPRQLADLAVVVDELLLRRQQRSRRASRPATSRPRPPPSRTRSSTCARRWPTPATPTRSTRSWPTPTGRRCPSGSGNRYSAERLDPPVGRWAAACGTATPTTPTTRSSRRSTARCGTPSTQTGLSNIKVLDLQSSLNGRRLCENTVGLLEEKGVATLDRGRRRRQDGVGQPAARPPARSSVRTRSRRACTPTTGARWPCGTACVRRTTAARPAGAAACGPPTGSTARASRT